MATRTRRNRHELALRASGLAYPETREDFPWGHRVLKVRGKIFAVLGKDEPELSLTVKLPFSAEGALQLPFCEPTGYGLGRSGWVTARFAPRAAVPLDVLRSWIDESYRAVAPKRLVAALPARTDARTASAGARAASRLFQRAAARRPAATPRYRAPAPSP